MNLLTVTKLKLGLATLVVAGGAAAVVLQNQTLGKLRNNNTELQSLLALSKSDNQNLSNQLATAISYQHLYNEKTRELMKLRGEYVLLKQQEERLKVLQSENEKLRHQLSASSVAPSVASPSAGDLVKQMNQCINYLRQIDAAKQMCALEHSLSVTNEITAEQILPYLSDQTMPVCPSGGEYVIGSLTNQPTCSITAHNVNW